MCLQKNGQKYFLYPQKIGGRRNTVKKEREPKEDLRKRVAKALELPKEAFCSLPFLTMTGRNELMIENYRGLMEYGTEEVRLSTAEGILRITGRGLTLKTLDREAVRIEGHILSVEFLS